MCTLDLSDVTVFQPDSPQNLTLYVPTSLRCTQHMSIPVGGGGVGRGEESHLRSSFGIYATEEEEEEEEGRGRALSLCVSVHS